jgi:TRAP-type C4-dicarboxylate transport system permease small subunit
VSLPQADAPVWSRARNIALMLPKIVLTALLVVAVIDMIIGVFLRYVMVPITDWLDLDTINFFWVEEIGETSLAWLTLIGAGIGIAERAHFTLRVVTHRMPLPAQRVIHVATSLLMAAFGGFVAWYGYQLVLLNKMLTSPALEVSLAWLYAAPVVGGVLILLYGLARALGPVETEAELDVGDAVAHAPLPLTSAGDD